jgi:PTH1 family peptidyl-tRNA hydrolase
MRIIVGLGNPGKEYAGTPHNLGVWAIDALAVKAAIRVTRPESKSLVGLGKIEGHDVVLAKPQTMMNRRGAAVVSLLNRYECTPAELIVISDDVAIPWGMIRVRENGSAGGHNGLKSIVAAAGTTEFVRVRLGVQPEHPLGDLADYVLGEMNASQRAAADDMIVSTSEAIEIILTRGAGPAMTRFNRRATPPDEITA